MIKFSISNFKGFHKNTEFNIKPLTLFVGPNSSGKSSCIHALATLGQTASTPNATVPLLLDHEYADVHLGRFIDVIHTKKYKDKIGFSITFPKVRLRATVGEKPLVEGDLSIILSYGSTLRTQEVFLQEMKIRIADYGFDISKITNKSEFNVVSAHNDMSFRTSFDKPFRLNIPDVRTEKVLFEYYALAELLRFFESELQKIHYLGPFRMSPKRMYPYKGGSPDKVGPEGEFGVQMLANEYISSHSKTHVKQISKWLGEMGLATDISLKRQGRSELFVANLSLKDGSEFPVADLGYGISQILPVLTQCAFCPDNSILLFEQPEIHLHTNAARKLPKVFIDVIKKKRVSVVAETHSPELVKQVFKEIAEGHISENDVAVYRIERKSGASTRRLIEIEKYPGGVDVYENWEKGVSME